MNSRKPANNRSETFGHHNGTFAGRHGRGFAALWVLFLMPAWALERQQLNGHVPAPTASMQAVRRLPASNRLNLAIGLPLRNEEELTALIEQLYKPASPQYRQYLTPEQFAKRFGPSEEDYETLI